MRLLGRLKKIVNINKVDYVQSQQFSVDEDGFKVCLIFQFFK